MDMMKIIVMGISHSEILNKKKRFKRFVLAT